MLNDAEIEGGVKNLTDRFLLFSKTFLFVQFKLFNLICLFAPSYVLKILLIFPGKEFFREFSHEILDYFW